MIFGSLLLIFAAIALAVAGVVGGSNVLLISSIVASLLSAVALVVGARQGVGLLAGPGEPDEAGLVDRDDAELLEEDAARVDEAQVPVGVAAGSGAPVGQPLPDAGAPRGAEFRTDSDFPVSGEAATSTGFPRSAEARTSAGTRIGHDAPAGTDTTGSTGFPGAGDAPGGPAEESTAVPVRPVPAQADPARLHPEDTSVPVPVITSLGSGLEPADDEPGSHVAYAEDDDPADEPPVEPATRAQRARVAQLDTEVHVLDGRPRYHRSGCVFLLARDDSETLPVSEAEELGFSPCNACAPVRHLLAG